MATYPTAVKAFTTRVNLTDKVDAGHVNDLQDEVAAVETDLLKAWTAVAFSAGNFTGSGSMTWGVDSADQVTFAYHKIGKRMTISFQIQLTDVAGVASTDLFITIPGGFTAATAMSTVCKIIDAGTAAAGLAYVSASGTRIGIRRIDDSNWTLTAADNTSVFGQITIETTT